MIEVIIAADEPAIFFESVREAEQYIEVNDVISGVYKKAFARNGMELKIDINDNFVNITTTNEFLPDELYKVVKNFLDAIGIITASNDLEYLINLCEPYISK